jgi:hypothetical protein
MPPLQFVCFHCLAPLPSTRLLLPGAGYAVGGASSSATGGDYSESDSDVDGESGSDEEREVKKKPVLTSSGMEKSITATGLGSLNRTRGLGTHRMTRGANRR